MGIICVKWHHFYILPLLVNNLSETFLPVTGNVTSFTLSTGQFTVPLCLVFLQYTKFSMSPSGMHHPILGLCLLYYLSHDVFQSFLSQH